MYLIEKPSQSEKSLARFFSILQNSISLLANELLAELRLFSLNLASTN